MPQFPIHIERFVCDADKLTITITVQNSERARPFTNAYYKFFWILTFRHRASSILGQAFHYSTENSFYICNQQIYFIISYLLERASLI